ncbi:MAG: pyridoxamine 5'-phosphate oxidase [Bacteroidetes bacterium]|nr:MAG: pyridoxamine 5'-phosphate oxidase [Bacteroidota bacterium]
MHSIRTDYVKGELRVQNMLVTPQEQLSLWIDNAIESSALDANAFCLSTVNADGCPKGRMVLVKEIKGEALIFYTNKGSSKAQDLKVNPRAAATFYWPELERQVCISGTVYEVSEDDNDIYFATRPRESQLGAWVSDQSQALDSRDTLNKTLKLVTDKYQGVSKIDRPPNWGGFRIEFERVEFWQGRASRLHDRVLYTKDGSGGWNKSLLQP